MPIAASEPPDGETLLATPDPNGAIWSAFRFDIAFIWGSGLLSLVTSVVVLVFSFGKD